MAAVAAVAAYRPDAASASTGAQSLAARRRLGALARGILTEQEIRALMASDGARVAGASGCADPSGLARLVRSDFRTGQTIDLEGVRFARSEVAAFLRA